MIKYVCMLNSWIETHDEILGVGKMERDMKGVGFSYNSLRFSLHEEWYFDSGFTRLITGGKKLREGHKVLFQQLCNFWWWIKR